MARLQTSQKFIAAVYDFAVDGGAISSINMGIFIPNNAVVNRFFVKTNTAPTGATATISFGHAGDTDAFMVVNGIAAFVVGEDLQGVDFTANPLEMTAFRQLQITIATAALTAGVIIACIAFTELDI